MLRSVLFLSLLGLVAAQQDDFDEVIMYIIIAIVVDIGLIAACYLALCRGESEPADPMAALEAAFKARNAKKYARALKRAREAGVASSDIPTVYSLQKVPETFKIPSVPKADAGPQTISAQLCFILDYTGSMSEQIKQAEKSCTEIVERVKAMKFPHMPNATVDLEMSAVCYNDWDPKTKSLGRPVVSVFGGQQIIGVDHDPAMSLDKFNLGGVFTKDVEGLMKWIKQPLGNGGSVPEELTGGLLAATHLPWKAEQKLAVVITDAPCHGKAYSSASHDGFCDKDTGLTCTGKPEVPLMTLQKKGVQVVILHTGDSGVASMCKKLQQTNPTLVTEKSSPSQTAQTLGGVMQRKLSLQPLTFILAPLTEEAIEHPAKGVSMTIDSGDEKKALVDAHGVVWMGFPSSNPKITVKRPAGGFDRWWEDQSEEQVITRGFDDDTYMFTIPPKAEPDTSDPNSRTV